MARRYARIKVTLWGDPDFRKMSLPAQHLYLLLVTSPKMNLCGVTDWRPIRISALTEGHVHKGVQGAADELTAGDYIVIDDETEEVLVRSFIRHDETIKTPNIAAAVAKDYAGVTSQILQGVIVHEIKRLQTDEPSWKGWGMVKPVLENPSIDPSTLKVSVKASVKVSGKESDIPLPSTLNQQPSSIREDVGRLCKHLADRIEENGSKRPEITRGWLDSARLLIDKDKRTEEQVHTCIDWCQQDEFWRTNILSMPKLREKYDQLRLKASQKRTNDRAEESGTDWMNTRVTGPYA